MKTVSIARRSKDCYICGFQHITIAVNGNALFEGCVKTLIISENLELERIGAVLKEKDKN